MTIEELAIQGQNKHLSSAERVYSNLYKMRNKTLMQTFLKADESHRNQHIATINGINFIDDAMSLSPNATWYSLFQSNTPVVWIVENLSSQEIDFSDILSTIKDKVNQVVVINNENPNTKLIAQLRKISSIVETNSMQEATTLGFHLAAEGMSVIFSPASGSEEIALQKAAEYNTCVCDL